MKGSPPPIDRGMCGLFANGLHTAQQQQMPLSLESFWAKNEFAQKQRMQMSLESWLQQKKSWSL